MKRLLAIVLFILTAQVRSQTLCTNTEVRTEAIILASAEEVWKLLIETADYKRWHPYISSVEGNLEVHHKIKVHTIDSLKKAGSFKAYVLTLEPNKQLAWGGSLGFIFRAKHYFIIEPITAHSVRFIQGEYWRGWFGKSFGKKIYKNTFSNFNVMNQNMKLILEPIVEDSFEVKYAR